ncbi:hypothetical protein FQN54_002921 [Arachnomyces sp. PD_36]|nr:hypothetical protein FQN54_002921 [Arachnomyces sp. PD_36]
MDLRIASVPTTHLPTFLSWIPRKRQYLPPRSGVMAHSHTTTIDSLNWDIATAITEQDMDTYYVTLQNKGKMLYSSYKASTVVPATQHPTGPSQQLKERYRLISRSLYLNEEDKELLKGYLAPEVRYIEILNEPQQKDDEAIYSIRFDTTMGTFMIWSANKSWDRSENSLWPSEICWQSWCEANKRDGTNSRGLSNIVIWSIINTLTRISIWRAERTSSHRGEVALPNGYREYTEGDPGFFAILGSPLGSCVLRMLIEHKGELEKQRIEKVVVLGVGENHDLDDFRLSRNAIFVLSPDRNEKEKGSANTSG